MNWRLVSRLSVVTLALLVVLTVALFSLQHGLGVAATLQGTDLGGTPASDFRLTDQFGQPISLSQFRGKPIILTFLYTRCPDICPLTAEKLHTVMLNLGSDAQRVAVLAVSTDPKGDDIAAALQFSETHRMTNYWHFLIGSHAALSAVWSSYNVYAAPTATTNNGTVTHTTALYVIDKQGHERVFLGDDFTSNELTADLKTLLGE